MKLNKYVRVKIKGGLGNQIFQYAAAKALAFRNGAQLFLNIDSYKYNLDRKFELDLYKIDAIVDKEKSVFIKLFEAIFGIKNSGIKKNYSEKGFAFDPNFFEQTCDVTLEGYFQSEKYFVDIADDIRSEFLFVKDHPPNIEHFINLIKDNESVAVHIRRGDYVSSSEANSFHGLCDFNYYSRSIDFLVSHIGRPIVLFIFSDDMAWVKKNIFFKFPIVYVDFQNEESAHYELKLMSLCKHNIIANSTYSWWGAWLGDPTGRVVISPVKWFSDSNIDTSDLIPDRWFRL